jgi:hypothetical protein
MENLENLIDGALEQSEQLEKEERKARFEAQVDKSKAGFECPSSIEALEEIEKLIPMCREELLKQVEARKQAGTAKSDREATRQLAEELPGDLTPEAIRNKVKREREKVGRTDPKQGRPSKLQQKRDKNAAEKQEQAEAKKDPKQIWEGIFKQFDKLANEIRKAPDLPLDLEKQYREAMDELFRAWKWKRLPKKQ